ncbi:helix-turn-helix transcriptional regulator [Paenibacillus sp. MWE-103]|uniref:Helix-turn-helix transcriptional regulator n=1 Tax=Paenibacillus artemisiicola TaxID=1172618 RepID=A0ABS3WF83_9BACL|nr:AraC family transcriptional regulator [Paenibacillus artemisiicola]MBO7746969.1 helix-turn-helix transcriptional regulator [Paenibacillus artemisiicola]
MSMRTAKVVKAPRELAAAPISRSQLKLNGLTVIESCTYTEGLTGELFLEHHLLLFVLKGNYTVRHGSQSYVVRENEMVLLQKAIVVEYEKHGEPGADYLLDYMMFFLHDELIHEFVKLADLKSRPAEAVPVSVKAASDRLIGYAASLKPLFREPERVDNGLVKIKLLELLFDVAASDERFLFQLAQLKQKGKRNIAEVVEENLFNPVTLSDLAYLSGMGLSTFKREFSDMYNTSPLQWIRGRRLDKARELLLHSPMSVTDVCFTTGFENAAHFSKAFKERHGISPSAFKQRSRQLQA